MSLSSAKACSPFSISSFLLKTLRLFYDCSIQKVLLDQNNNNNKKINNNNHDHNHINSNINSIMPIFEKSRVKVSLMAPRNHNNFYQRS